MRDHPMNLSMSYDAKTAIAMTANLRNLADHIELNGPGVIVGGTLSINVENELIHSESERGHYRAHVRAKTCACQPCLAAHQAARDRARWRAILAAPITEMARDFRLASL